MNLAFVRLHIESNDRVQEVFPYEEINDRRYGLAPSNPWGTESITVKNNRMDGAPSVYAVGLEGSISGIRADVIIVDDLVDMNNVMTDSQRDKVNSFWDNVVLPTLNPDGRIFCVGTRWHAKDFYSRLLEDPMYKDNTFIFPALKLDEHGELFVNEDGEYESYWPDRWPVEKLLKTKERMGSLAFNAQYMCDVRGYAGQLFDPEHLHYYNPLQLMPIWGNLDFMMSIDPNVTEDPESDNTAIVTGAVDRKNGNVYILDIFAKPLGFVNQVKEMQRYGGRMQVSVGNHKYEPEIKISKIGVESTAYQRSLQKTGYLVGLPVIEVKQHNKNKMTRILGLQPHIENGRVRFPDPDVCRDKGIRVAWWEGFYNEYCAFPKGRRDDMMDALEILVNMVSESFGVSGIPYGPGDNTFRRLFQPSGRLIM